MIDKQHTRGTLMNYSKSDLVEHCMALEHNISALKERFEVQYSNCMKIVDDMKLLNENLRRVRSGEE